MAVGGTCCRFLQDLSQIPGNVNTYWALSHFVLKRPSAAPVAGSFKTCASVNTYWPFLQFYYTEPAVGSIVGSAKCQHLWGFFAFLLKLLSAEPIAGSAGTCNFCDTYHTFWPYTAPPRSAIILLIKERGPKETRGPQAWAIN